MISVFLVDDHPIVRAGLRALLTATGDIQIVGEACDGLEALAAATAPDFCADVLILDISLPRLGGVEVLRQLQISRPQLPVLMMSMHAEDQYAQHLQALGAAGYVSKDRSEHVLVTAVRSLAQGRTSFRRRLGDELTEDEEHTPPHLRLSGRQLQVFLLIVAGRTVSQIAAELGLTVSTVSTHLGYVKERLGACSVGELVAYAHRTGLAH